MLSILKSIFSAFDLMWRVSIRRSLGVGCSWTLAKLFSDALNWSEVNAVAIFILAAHGIANRLLLGIRLL